MRSFTPHPSLSAAVTALALLLTLAGAPRSTALSPFGAPFRLDDGGTCRESAVDLARLADGGFVAVWVQGVEPDDDAVAPLRVHARLFDADGTPRGPAFVIDDALPGGAFTPAVAATGDTFLVAWVRGSGLGGLAVNARLFAADGTPAGDTLPVAGTRDVGDVDVAATGAGYRLVWVQPSPGVDSLATRTVATDGASSGNEVLFSPGLPLEDSLRYRAPRIAADETGFTVAVQAIVDGILTPTGPVVDALRFTAPKAPYDPVRLPLPGFSSQPEGSVSPPAVGTSAVGDTVVAWRLGDAVGRVRGLQARLFAADGGPRTGVLDLTGPGTWTALSDPVLTVAADGTFHVAWMGRRLGTSEVARFAAAFDAGGRPSSTERSLGDASVLLEGEMDLLRLGDDRLVLSWSDRLPTPGIPGVAPCDSSGIVALRLNAAPQQDLLLHHDRFAVRVAWQDPYAVEERAGLGAAVPLNDKSGWFWFFRPGNAELVVKVLDGRPVNGHWWVFHGGLSTVAYELTVTDHATGAVWSYDKPPFVRLSAADTTAFAAIDAAAGVSGPAARTAGLDVVTARSHPDSAAGPCTDPSLPVVIRPGLCLHERFEVEVELDDPLLHRILGSEVLSSDTGRLWFFREDNTELLVKVLDGRPVNGHWWVFSGALTNVGYTLVVRDTESGDEQRYPVPAGNFESIADTTAF